MRQLLALSLVTLSLAACSTMTGNVSKSTTIEYLLTFSEAGAAKRSELTEAAQRVVTNRMEALGGKAVAQKAKPDGDNVRLTVGLSDPALAEPLTEGLAAPFSFRIMRAAKEGETPDITLEKFGGYKEAGLTEKHVQWLFASSIDGPTPRGVVTIELTPEGKEQLKKIFAENKGMTVGIFVRDKLVSQLTDPGTEQESIVISGIPSPEIATIFADDVNVGVHMGFKRVDE
jgi:hypothetical protein